MTESIDKTQAGPGGKGNAAVDRELSGGPGAEDRFPAAKAIPDNAGAIDLSGFEPPGEELYALLPELGRRIAEEEVPAELHRLARALGSGKT